MKQKIITLAIALMSVFGVQAYDFQSGDLYYNIISKKEPFAVEITFQNKYSSKSNNNYVGLTSVVVPAAVSYEGVEYSVTKIGKDAFRGCASLLTVDMSNSALRFIGSFAFCGCTGLTEIKLPNTITEIGSSAFSGCTGLTSVDLPNGIPAINDHLFYNCSSLNSISIPNSVAVIGSYAFYACRSLPSVEIPFSVRRIDNSAFENCSKMTSVVLPESVQLGTDVFKGFTGYYY